MWTEPRLSQWASAANGRLLGNDQVVGQVSTDSRELTPGDVYVALKGEQFDGHSYVEAALKQGAAAIVVEQEMPVDAPQLIVPDTRLALGQLAGLLRQAFPGQVIALTGSAGKTSTRAMLQRIFEQDAGLLATAGNFNNDIGVPKTWFRINDEHRRVLLELGANAQGEIAWTAGFSQPYISLLLNASEAHSEGFGGLDGVRQAKGEIIDGTLADGHCVLNCDDPAFAQWRERAGSRSVLRFGQSAEAEVRLDSYVATGFGSIFQVTLPEGEIEVRWPMLGRHMALNAAAAAATAWVAGMSLKSIVLGLARMQPEPGRLQPLPSLHGGLLVDDSYNANPASVRAAIDVLSETSDDTVLVLGDMAELGTDANELHADVGRYAKGRIRDVWTLGNLSQATSAAFGGEHFESLDRLVAALPSRLTEKTAVLVKGSRSAAMERVVETLRRKA
ncbi:UDP-N-acetylmuramoyl-tripeptide--D-alanyl-D-alanine ligase [Saccharospirillum mangrovi]|uniref:UDP-N-acetylmuramoyl-tripeptide--D-alanyl-D- alanine ligase n=1 Tax=Saccharospirillum mangrovi TaxID=2161747 RepID=UPI00130077FB|nr:UDP-N-acetylmuramoyl-tripeptide--D-alanyl-D-alanine ligase [Saccharospirillum mangrovi]